MTPPSFFRRSRLSAALMAACASAMAGPLYIAGEHSPPACMRVGNEIVGRETDKVREILARAGVPYTIDVLPWKRAYMMVQIRNDMCVYSMSRTPEREKLFKWVGPTDEAAWVFYGRADHVLPLNTLEDARSLRIGTYSGDARDDYLRERGFHVESVQNDLSNPQKLLLNRIDLWAVSVRADAAGLPSYGWSPHVVPLLTFNHVKVYLACSRSVPDATIGRMNAALAAMRHDGTFAKLERKYVYWGGRK